MDGGVSAVWELASQNYYNILYVHIEQIDFLAYAWFCIYDTHTHSSNIYLYTHALDILILYPHD